MMRFRHPALRRRLARFRRADRGVVAVEFALILPVMLLIYIGMTQVTLALSVDRKITLLSRTVADLVGRSPNLTQAEMTDIVAAALTVMQPFDDGDVSIVLSSALVVDDGEGALEAELCWSFANENGTAHNVGDTRDVPAGYETEGASFVLAEVSTVFTPVLTIAPLFETITLADVSAWPVRNGSQVEFDGQSCTPPAPPAT